MNKKELSEEVEAWRNIMTYLPDDLRGFLAQINQKVIVIKRDGGIFQGNYLQPRLEITGHIFRTIERRYDDLNKNFFIYETESILDNSNIVDFKWIKNTYEDVKDEEPPQGEDSK